MHYLGGKFRIMKPIAEIINNYLEQIPEDDRTFVSLFVGAGNVEQWIHCNKILNDKHPYLIALWKDLQNGRQFPMDVDEAEYQRVKANQDDDPGLAGFVGFGCAYSGKWWGGYARDPRSPRSYASNAMNGLNKKIKNGILTNATFTCSNYADVIIPDGSVVYCDPPYSGVTPFCTSLLGKFDHHAFWEYIRKISEKNIVLVSEFNAPDDFECIWSKDRLLDMASADGTKAIKTEKLFKYKNIK